MIDGIVYYIGMATNQQKNMPTLIFSHVDGATLDKAKERTKKYKIASNVFGVHKLDDKVQAYDKVNAGFGNCEFGPLTVKDGDRSNRLTYYKDVYVGQVKEGDRILLQGTKIGSMYFDQHGQFLQYEAEVGQMTFGNQANKVDLQDHTPVSIKDPLGMTGKNILLKQDMTGDILNVNIMDPEDEYTKGKTGKGFVTEKDKDKGEKIDEYFYTSIDTKRIIAENRIAIYEGLKKIASDDVREESLNLFNFVME